MAGRLNLEILTPERIVESLEVEQVTLPGTEGQFGVLPGHAALLSSLEIGEMSFSVAGERPTTPSTGASPRYFKTG